MKNKIDFDRSTRRTTKLGEYGEQIVEHWLTRSGFHTSRADAEGIDVLAVRQDQDIRLAFSVKARLYEKFSSGGVFHENSLEKIKNSSEIWNSIPWISLYAESEVFCVLVAMPLSTYLNKYQKKNSKWFVLDISRKGLEVLRNDKEVQYLELGISGHWNI